MKKILLYSTVLLISACNMPTAAELQQQKHHFICKSLIDGYLTAQQLGQFKLWKQVQPASDIQSTQYIYHQPTVNGVMLSMNPQPEIRFQCQQTSTQHYALLLGEQLRPVLQVMLPPREQTGTLLTASRTDKP